jgi:hypothetical protein
MTIRSKFSSAVASPEYNSVKKIIDRSRVQSNILIKIKMVLKTKKRERGIHVGQASHSGGTKAT